MHPIPHLSFLVHIRGRRVRRRVQPYDHYENLMIVGVWNVGNGEL